MNVTCVTPLGGGLDLVVPSRARQTVPEAYARPSRIGTTTIFMWSTTPAARKSRITVGPRVVPAAPASHLEPGGSAYQAKGVRFLAVAAQDTRPRVLAFARTSRITYPVLLDPAGTLAQRLQMSAVPPPVVLDRDGRIAAGTSPRPTKALRRAWTRSSRQDRQATTVKKARAAREGRY